MCGYVSCLCWCAGLPVLSPKTVARLPLGLPLVDDVFPGFEPGDFAVFHGLASNLILFELCVRCQLPPSKGGLGSSAVFVDGGNVFNPYVVSGIARGYGLNPKDVLERIYVSRAFTAYQLSSLILEKLEKAVRKFRSKLVAVSDISSLFLDRDVPKTEAQDLFMKVCGRLEKIAKEKKVIVVASHTGRTGSNRCMFLETVLYGRANIVFGLKQSRGVLKLSLESHPRLKPFTIELRENEVRLTDFMEVKTGGKDGSIV